MEPTVRNRALELLSTHSHRYPAWRIVDAYKLLFQACMGPGHSVSDSAEARRRLFSEWNQIPAAPGKVLQEDVGLHAPLWRLHLGAAKAQGIAPDTVLGEFLRCVHAFPRRPGILVHMWFLLMGEIRSGRVAVTDAADLDVADLRLRESGFPMPRHSAAFHQTYSPAYRLVGTAVRGTSLRESTGNGR
jgi:hypothetical protein